MSVNHSLLAYFFAASPVVKLVLFILLGASIASWTYIIHKWLSFKRFQRHMRDFDEALSQSKDVAPLYQTLRGKETMGLESLFKAGVHAYSRMRELRASHDETLQSMERAMRVAEVKELDKLELHLSFLATVGSTSPYIGLFGTVWGIMMAFHGLSGAQQVTIAMVAPGISEALIATAMGLFAAIPAVIAFNRFSTQINRIANHFDAFRDELTLNLLRSFHGPAR